MPNEMGGNTEKIDCREREKDVQGQLLAVA